MTFVEIRSGPVALFGFNFLIVLLISSVVASGNPKEVLFMPSSGFSGLPIQFRASPEVFSTIFI